MAKTESRSASAAWFALGFIGLQVMDGFFKRPLANAGQLPFWAYDAGHTDWLPPQRIGGLPYCGRWPWPTPW